MVDRKHAVSPTVLDTFRNLSTDSTVFAVQDLLHSYFQIRLSLQAKPYFCFHSQEFGIMMFNGALQGYAGSSNELIAATDVALSSLPCSKMMDDMLIKGWDMADLVQKSRLLFERCREKKLYFS